MGSYTIMAMSGLRTIRFPTRRNFIAFLATPSFVFNPRNVKKTRNQDLSQTGFQNFDMGMKVSKIPTAFHV